MFYIWTHHHHHHHHIRVYGFDFGLFYDDDSYALRHNHQNTHRHRNNIRAVVFFDAAAFLNQVVGMVFLVLGLLSVAMQWLWLSLMWSLWLCKVHHFCNDEQFQNAIFSLRMKRAKFYSEQLPEPIFC